jgi:hypothetical protein
MIDPKKVENVPFCPVYYGYILGKCQKGVLIKILILVPDGASDEAIR